MLTVLLTPAQKSWVSKLLRFGARDFRVSIPESWSEAQPDQRLRWWRRAVQMEPLQAQMAALNDLLKKLPRRIRSSIPTEDVAAMVHALRWIPSRPECVDVPLPVFSVRGVAFYLPKSKGQNVTCGEFAVCDDLYKLVAAKNDISALEMLTAVLYRPADKNREGAAARGDVRVPYNNKDEATVRLQYMGTPPAEMQMAALMYFAGLKTYIHRVYGRYIFDDVDPEEPPSSANGPDFGWWGTLQQVAESGMFGTLPQVYQAYLHEVCVYLVRKRQQADAMIAQQEQLKMNRD